MSHKTKWWYYGVALIPPFMGAMSYVLSKYIITDISPISLLFYRWIVALAILTPFALKPFLAEIVNVRAHFRILFIIATSGVTFFNFFVYYALQYTTSTNTSIIVNIFPVVVLALGVIINQDKLRKSHLYSIIFSFIGVIIILSHGNIMQGLSSLFHNIGDFIALAATLCWAIYVFSVKYKPTNLSFRSFIYSTFLIGTILIFPLYLFDIFYLKHTFEPTMVNMSVIFCLGFGVSIIGMMVLNISIVKIGPNISAILFYFAPLFTSIMAVMVLEEKLQPFHLVGISSILLGINFPLVAHFFAYKNRVIISKEEKLLDND
ncbi:MAG: DMT family transporter [Rickettsiaceae bacterium]|nr:DMT family transporter [Rickettsiaceae bacterium]